MTQREELFEMLNDCPFQWFMVSDDSGSVEIRFVYEEDEELEE